MRSRTFFCPRMVHDLEPGVELMAATKRRTGPRSANLGVNPDLLPGKTRSQLARQSDTAALVVEDSVDTRCPVKC